jgi:hypothetical protein
MYDQEVSIHARSMIGLMVLPFAAFLPLVFFGQGKAFAVHVVFTVHSYAFLSLLCLLNFVCFLAYRFILVPITLWRA